MNQGAGQHGAVFSNSMAAYGIQEDSTAITPIKNRVVCKLDSNSKTKRGKFVAVNDNERCLTVGDVKTSAYKLATYLKSKAKPSIFDTTYSKDYFNYMKSKEMDSVVDPGYLSRQSEVNFSDRMVMVDYMIEVKKVLDISMNTVYLAVTYIDKLLDIVNIKEDNFQLVGLITLLIASKMEDVHSKAMNARIVSKLMSLPISSELIVETERSMLEARFFKMGLLTRHHYVEKLLKVFKSKNNKETFECVTLMTLYSSILSSVRPSTVIYCILEQLQRISEDSKYQKLDSSVDNNGDFEAAKEYLGVRIINTQDYDLCTKSIYDVFVLIRKEDFPGFEKVCGPIIQFIKGLPLSMH